MSEEFYLRLEIPVVAPDTPTTVSSQLKRAISKAAVDSDVEKVIARGKVEPTFEQRLPTKEEVELSIAILTFVIHEAPTAWPHLKAFLEYLGARLKKTTPIKINVHIIIGSKKVHVEGLTPGDAFKLATKECEMYLLPPTKG
jgi:hypothetical protein